MLGSPVHLHTLPPQPDPPPRDPLRPGHRRGAAAASQGEHVPGLPAALAQPDRPQPDQDRLSSPAGLPQR